MSVKQLERIFEYNNLELKDIDSNFSPKEVLDVYANQYPELVNADIEGPEIKEGKAYYKFAKNIGTKG